MLCRRAAAEPMRGATGAGLWCDGADGQSGQYTGNADPAGGAWGGGLCRACLDGDGAVVDGLGRAQSDAGPTFLKRSFFFVGERCASPYVRGVNGGGLHGRAKKYRSARRARAQPEIH